MTDTTIVNTPASQDSGTTAVVAALIVVLMVGGFIWYRMYYGTAPRTATPTTTVEKSSTVNISLPVPPTGADTTKTGSGAVK